MVLAFWINNIHPITGMKNDTGFKKPAKKKKLEKEINPETHILISDAVAKYGFQKRSFSRWCEKNEIKDYLLYYRTSRYYNISLLKQFLATGLIEEKPKGRQVPEGYVSLAKTARAFNIPYNTFYDRYKTNKLPSVKVAGQIYVLESEINKFTYK